MYHVNVSIEKKCNVKLICAKSSYDVFTSQHFSTKNRVFYLFRYSTLQHTRNNVIRLLGYIFYSKKCIVIMKKLVLSFFIFTNML